uniref:Conserved plasma membrane protein n=1 Tax=Steinernema glaseri TaxID=37863 RepID=A0A1I8AK84_9BILA
MDDLPHEDDCPSPREPRHKPPNPWECFACSFCCFLLVAVILWAMCLVMWRSDSQRYNLREFCMGKFTDKVKRLTAADFSELLVRPCRCPSATDLSQKCTLLHRDFLAGLQTFCSHSNAAVTIRALSKPHSMAQYFVSRLRCLHPDCIKEINRVDFCCNRVRGIFLDADKELLATEKLRNDFWEAKCVPRHLAHNESLVVPKKEMVPPASSVVDSALRFLLAFFHADLSFFWTTGVRNGQLQDQKTVEDVKDSMEDVMERQPVTHLESPIQPEPEATLSQSSNEEFKSANASPGEEEDMKTIQERKHKKPNAGKILEAVFATVGAGLIGAGNKDEDEDEKEKEEEEEDRESVEDAPLVHELSTSPPPAPEPIEVNAEIDPKPPHFRLIGGGEARPEFTSIAIDESSKAEALPEKEALTMALPENEVLKEPQSPSKGKKETLVNMDCDPRLQQRPRKSSCQYIKVMSISVIIFAFLALTVFIFWFGGSAFQSLRKSEQCRIQLVKSYFNLRNLTEAGRVVSGCRLFPSDNDDCQRRSHKLKEDLENEVPLHRIEAVCAEQDSERIFALGRRFTVAEEHIWAARRQYHDCFLEFRGFARDCFGGT